MNTGKGLLQQIQENPSEYKYPNLTRKDLEDFLEDLTKGIKQPIQYTILVGYIGMVIFDLEMQGIKNCELWLNSNISFTLPHKNLKDTPIIVDLDKKHGTYKAIARRLGFEEIGGKWSGQYYVEVRKGTEIVDNVNTFEEVFNKYGKPATVLSCKQFHDGRSKR